jgi:hypothetical protein
MGRPRKRRREAGNTTTTTTTADPESEKTGENGTETVATASIPNLGQTSQPAFPEFAFDDFRGTTAGLGDSQADPLHNGAPLSAQYSQAPLVHGHG